MKLNIIYQFQALFLFYVFLYKINSIDIVQIYLMQVTRTKRQIENSNSTLKSWTISIMPTCFHNLIICYASNNTDSPEIHNNRNFDVKKGCTLSIGKHMIKPTHQDHKCKRKHQRSCYNVIQPTNNNHKCQCWCKNLVSVAFSRQSFLSEKR